MKNRRKKSLIFIVILLVACLGIGYAYLTTTLSINGTTDVDMNNWDVYFDNIQVDSWSVTGDQVISAPEVGADETSVSFHIRLKEPGDVYSFTVDAKNDGTIDAMISSFNKTINGTTTIPPYLRYIVTYGDGMEIENNHLLAAESLETYSVYIEYRSDINPEDLPSSAQVLELSFEVEYIQADSNAREIKETLYSYNAYSIGREIPYENYIYDNNSIFPDHEIHFKYIGRGHIVESAYLGFGVDGTKYYVKGAGATFNDTTGLIEEYSPYFEDNKIALQHLFGASNCAEYVEGSTIEYRCSSGGLFGSATNKGFIFFSEHSGTYSITEYGHVSYDPEL